MELTQDEFDELVATNMDTFDMSREEAVTSAIEELEMQGYDVTGIITTFEGDRQGVHPVLKAFEDLQDATEIEDVKKAVHVLKELADANESEFVKLVAPKGIVACLLQSLSRMVSQQQFCECHAALHLLQLLMLKQAPCRREYYDRKDSNPSGDLEDVILGLINQDECSHIVASALKVAEAASLSHAKNKASIMSSGVPASVIMALASNKVVLIESAASLVKVLCAEDCDVISEEPASKGFCNARDLQELGIPEKLCAATIWLLNEKAEDDYAPASIACLEALGHCMATADICKSAALNGLLECAFIGVTRAPRIRRAALYCLRKAAIDDDAKSYLIEAGGVAAGVEAIASVAVAKPSQSSSSEAFKETARLAEQAFGLLAALCLRRPDAAEKAYSLGAMEATANAMKAFASSWKVQQQACLFIRNLVARSPHLREKGRTSGLGTYANVVLDRFNAKKSVADAARAALRDLEVNSMV